MRTTGDSLSTHRPIVRGLIFTDLDGTLLDHDTYEFAPAVAALAAARAASVPVILCSSKTRAEMLVWQERLGIDSPFISENGGAVFYTGSGPLRRCLPDCFDGMPAKVFGRSYPVLRHALEELRRGFGLPVRGLGDMELSEVVRITGLPPEDAERARERDFDEPFVWLTEPKEDELDFVRHWLSAQRFQFLRGGRLWHLVGGNDKAGAVRWLLNAFAKAGGQRPPSLGLGDSENDLPMLLTVNTGVLVERPGGGHLNGAHADIALVPGIGPLGWARAVENWLRRVCPAQPRKGRLWATSSRMESSPRSKSLATATPTDLKAS